MKQLIIFTGLPCTGKSTLSTAVAKKLGLILFSVDPIEAAMLRSGIPRNHELGIAAYEIAKTLAQQNLEQARNVIIDAVSPVEWARNLWRDLATSQGAELKIIECILLNPDLHRQRVESRIRYIPGYPEVTWEQVEARRKEYEPWTDKRLVIDTSFSQSEAVKSILRYIAE